MSGRGACDEGAFSPRRAGLAPVGGSDPFRCDPGRSALQQRTAPEPYRILRRAEISAGMLGDPMEVALLVAGRTEAGSEARGSARAVAGSAGSGVQQRNENDGDPSSARRRHPGSGERRTGGRHPGVYPSGAPAERRSWTAGREERLGTQTAACQRRGCGCSPWPANSERSRCGPLRDLVLLVWSG